MKLIRIPKKNNMRMLKIVVGGVVLMGLGVGRVALSLKPRPLKPIAQLELHRFVGKWYEIARKPISIEQKSFKNIITQYSLIDKNKLKVEWLYNTGEGKLGQLFGEATVINPPDNSRFKIGYLPEFLHGLRAKSYMVIRIDPDYQIALISDKKRRHFWLLSREPKLHQLLLQDYLSFCQEQGFKLNDVIYVEHG